MKKILAALLVGAFGISAMAQSIVYDYRATIKRIDPQYKIRTVKTSSSSFKAVTESYGVASDTISGYVMLPRCAGDCNGTLVSSLDSDDFEGTAYLVRRGDKLSKKAKLPYVVKTDAWAQAAIFGKNAYIVGGPEETQTETPSDVKQLKSAWMWLWFQLPGSADTKTVIDSGLLIPAASGEDVILGFLGLDVQTETRGVRNAGFGTAKLISHTEAASLGFCSGSSSSTTSCLIVQSISGSVQGEYRYTGLCNHTPMWDLCDQTSPLDEDDWIAPITGTWTLKYNAALTKLDDSAKEDAILKKLKASSSNMYLFESAD